MNTAYLVGNYAQISHLPPERQRAAIALARNYGFAQLSFYQYLLKYVALPYGIAIALTLVPWLVLPANAWLSLAVTILAGVTGYWIERYLHRRMIQRGLALYCSDRHRLVVLMEHGYRRKTPVEPYLRGRGF